MLKFKDLNVFGQPFYNRFYLFLNLLLMSYSKPIYQTVSLTCSFYFFLSAQIVVDKDFTKYNVTPNAATFKTMKRKDELKSMGLVQKLKNILQKNGNDSTMQHLIGLVNDGKGTTAVCNWGMNQLCNSSLKCIDFIQIMNEKKIDVDETTLNTLIYKLIVFENNVKAAQDVIEIDFPKYFLEPNSVTFATMKRETKWKKKMNYVNKKNKV